MGVLRGWGWVSRWSLRGMSKRGTKLRGKGNLQCGNRLTSRLVHGTLRGMQARETSSRLQQLGQRAVTRTPSRRHESQQGDSKAAEAREQRVARHVVMRARETSQFSAFPLREAPGALEASKRCIHPSIGRASKT